ncbi:S49 family peptidase [Georhizobium sp. MAB10]|uniref:S49 family peptidase n=1 Tax=Georhizobium sp. MAB10 TaxID=3028319 RepID=UPI0038560BDD
MIAMPEIAARMFNTPLMLDVAKADVIARAFGPRILGGTVDVDLQGANDMGILPQRLNRWRASDGTSAATPHRIGAVALIEVEGSLANKGTHIGQSSGVTSYEGIAAQLEEVANDDSIKGLVVEIDSFGGMVDGCFACAEKLHRLSLQKPTIAILTDHACSAAYLIASACRSIIIPSTGFAGSIGVISMHVDMSGAAAKQGLTVTILRAGAKKAKPGPFEAMSEEEYAESIAEMEAMRVEFADAVGRYRGARLTKDNALATEAAVYRGAKAVDLGLVDAVALPEDALAAFIAEMDAAGVRDLNHP